MADNGAPAPQVGEPASDDLGGAATEASPAGGTSGETGWTVERSAPSTGPGTVDRYVLGTAGLGEADGTGDPDPEADTTAVRWEGLVDDALHKRSTAPAAERRRPTMRDVAALAGVSLKTVSRVVNGESGVSPILMARVRSAIEELGFRPNAGASSLRRTDGKTATLGLLLQDVANPFSAALMRAVEDVAARRGVVVFCASLDEDGERELSFARTFIDRRADGLIIMPTGIDQSFLAPELAAGTAVVCVDREPVNLDVDCVVTTNSSGSAEGVRHLAAAGHTRIAYLGDRHEVFTAGKRYEGYLKGLSDCGLPFDPSLVVHDLHDPAIANGAVSTLLTRPNAPTALFTAQNLVTVGALRALRRLGRQHSVALVGFDDFPLADMVDPGVTVVAQDPTAIGRTAASVLFNRLAGDDSAPARHIVPTTLIRRGSGEISPAGAGDPEPR